MKKNSASKITFSLKKKKKKEKRKERLEFKNNVGGVDFKLQIKESKKVTFYV
jgi:hypothetical protein